MGLYSVGLLADNITVTVCLKVPYLILRVVVSEGWGDSPRVCVISVAPGTNGEKQREDSRRWCGSPFRWPGSVDVARKGSRGVFYRWFNPRIEGDVARRAFTSKTHELMRRLESIGY